MSDEPIILDTRPLGFPWETADPFLFCVHHLDAYPAGNDKLGPATSLAGRNLGMDFEGKDGWRMYHGEEVPGFPQHPHRGFETVTIMRSGYVDHSDSLGATARFGPGDVQWLTAGQGIVHCEMFPLLKPDADNPLELFQIWLNLPKADKMVAPHFSMLWSATIPRVVFKDKAGRETEVTVIAGQLDDRRGPPPPPHSWASRQDTGVAIWTIRMAPKAVFTMPKAGDADVLRTVYFFGGSSLVVAGEKVGPKTAVMLRSDRPGRLEAGDDPVDILVLQGKPIGESIAQHGPFVMNTRAEIEQAIADYRRTRFGGWPWPNDAPVHARSERRFAKHADGRVEHIDE
jgi:quercetin 2,3-dioxygenase